MTIFGGKSDSGLFTLLERENIFQNAGIDFAVELAFEEIKDLSAQEFLRLLTAEFSIKAFVCGDDFRFGKGALGTSESLKRDTQVCVEIVPLVMANGKKISSSEIKDLLKTGDITGANELLGEAFFLIGKVFEDRKIGRTLGFPTANILYPKSKFTIKTGVYETRVEYQGKLYKGITNYGARPTYENESVLTETFLHGFSGDLYGEELKVSFVWYLRPVQKFESESALKKQLEKDRKEVINDD
jgi:riboflavin kinase/FMN adenylyltransferase